MRKQHDQDPRDENGNVIYDNSVTLLDTWRAMVLLGWAVQRGTAILTTPKSAERARENFDILPLPEEAFNKINNIQTRQRLNQVVSTGVPDFIPKIV